MLSDLAERRLSDYELVVPTVVEPPGEAAPLRQGRQEFLGCAEGPGADHLPSNEGIRHLTSDGPPC